MLEPADPYEPGEDFRFIASIRKIFSPIQKEENFVQLVCSAPKLGLLFASNSSLIKVYQLQELADKNNLTPFTEFEVTGGKVTHVSVNCDGLILIVVAIINDVPNAFFFDTQNVSAAVPFYSSPLSTKPGSRVTSLAWNPTDPSCLAIAFSTGDLASLNLKDSSVQFASHREIGACVVSWSAKGKQLAVGKVDGTLSLYKTDLSLVRSIAAPPMEGVGSVVSITWFTNTEFFVGYLLSIGIPALYYILAPKGAAPAFSNFEDVCYSSDDSRPIVYYNQFIPEWNVLLVLSSHGIEMGIVGKSPVPDVKFPWCQWFPDDSAKAMLQFINVVEETYPLGFAIDFTSQKMFPLGDERVKGPFPLLAVLSTGGELNLFHMDNSLPDAVSLVKAPQPISAHKVRRPETYGQPPTSNFIRHPQTAKVEQQQPPPPSPPPLSSDNSSAPLPTPVVSLPVAPPVTPIAAPPTAPHPQGNLSFSSPSVKNESFIGGSKGFSFSTPIKPPQQPPPQTPSIPPITTAAAAAKPSSSPLPVKEASSAPSLAAPFPTVSAPKTPLTPAQKPVASGMGSKPPVTKISKEAMLSLLKKEMEQFEKEIQLHCNAATSDKDKIGTKEEADAAIHNMKNVETLMKDVKSTTKEQSSEICQLHQGIIDAFTIYEDAKSYSTAKRNSRNLTYLQLRPLDPYTRKKLEDIRSKYGYLTSQIADANTKLDLEWEEFCEQKKYKRRGPVVTGEILYRSILNLHHLRVSHEKCVDLLSERMKTLIQGNFSQRQMRNKCLSEEVKSSFAFGQENTWKVSSPMQSLPTQKLLDLQNVLSQRRLTPIRNRSTSKFQVSSNESFDAAPLPIFPDLELSQKYEDISEPSSPDKSQDGLAAHPLAALKSFVGSVDTTSLESASQPSLPTQEKDTEEPSLTTSSGTLDSLSLDTGVKSESLLISKLGPTPANNADTKSCIPASLFSKTLSEASAQSQISFENLKPEEKLDSLFKVIPSAAIQQSLSLSSQPSASSIGGSPSIFSLPPTSIPAPSTSAPFSFSFFSSASKDSPSTASQTPTFAASKPTASSTPLFTLPVSSKSVASFPAPLPTSAPATSNILFTTSPLFSDSQSSTTASSLFVPKSSTTSITCTSTMTSASISSKMMSTAPQTSSLSPASSIFASSSYFSTPSSSSITTLSQSISSSIFITATSESSQAQPILSFSGPSSSSADSPGLALNSTSASTLKTFGNLGSSVFGAKSPFGENKGPTSGISLFGGESQGTEKNFDTAPENSEKAPEGEALKIAAPDVISQSEIVVASTTIAPVISSFTSATIVTSPPSSTSGKLSALLSASSSSGSVFELPANSPGILASATSSGDAATSDPNSNNSGSSGIFKTSTESQSGLFGSTSSVTITTTQSIFKQPATSSGIFGNAGTSFANNGFFSSATTTTTGSIFGTNTITITTTSGGAGIFGNTTVTSTGVFGAPTQSGLFGKTSEATSTPFGSATAAATSNSSSFFGGGVNKNLFGNTSSADTGSGIFGGSVSSASIFGSTTTPASSTSVFGAAKTSAPVFGGAATIGAGQEVFGESASTAGKTGSIFGESSASGNGIFGGSSTSGAPFGGSSSISTSGNNTGGIFGNNQPSSNTSSWNSSSPFSQASTAASPFSSGSMFSGLGGAPSAENASKNVFGSVSSMSQPQANIFGNQASTPFGAPVKQEAVSASSPFAGSGTFSPVKSSPSFGAPATFGGSPSFGGSKFGASPMFGGSASFGSLGSGSGTTGGGFSNFASSGGTTFGALAGSSATSSGSIFGGQSENTPSFGGLNQNTSTGSFTSTGFSGSSFTSWR